MQTLFVVMKNHFLSFYILLVLANKIEEILTLTLTKIQSVRCSELVEQLQAVSGLQQCTDKNFNMIVRFRTTTTH